MVQENLSLESIDVDVVFYEENNNSMKNVVLILNLLKVWLEINLFSDDRFELNEAVLHNLDEYKQSKMRLNRNN